MVLTRSPLRISLGGGGTDLPSYYRNHGGFLISAAIDKYVFVSVTRPFTLGISLKYSRLEYVQKVADVQHPIIRECLALMKSESPRIEITTLADIPAGTGLGSSGSFTTALLKALYAHEKLFLHPDELARLACHVEIDLLKEPIGKQDQYIAAFGGITCFTFSPDESVEAVPLKLGPDTLLDLEDNLLLFFTGQHRSASSILKDQDVRTRDSDSEMISNLHEIKDLATRSKKALEDGRCAAFGELMHEHWVSKKKRSDGITNPAIDAWYELGRANGAIGGKVVGAGGGGFLLFYAENRARLRKAMAGAGLEEVRFRFDFEGTKVLLS
jgi:D-glycero-alpha-D-manno-heptose-7-phosphate kinase